MSIKDTLAKARKAINKDVTAIGVGQDIREAAILAVTHGLKSEHGQKYLALFCDTKNELARLTVENDDDPNYMPQMRAYFASDAICTPDTNTGFAARLLKPEIELEPVADEFLPEGTPDPSDIRDNNLAALLRQA